MIHTRQGQQSYPIGDNQKFYGFDILTNNYKTNIRSMTVLIKFTNP